MTLNVNINVENSIKNIYLLISQMFRTCYCRMILVFLSFLFLPDDSGDNMPRYIHCLLVAGLGFHPAHLHSHFSPELKPFLITFLETFVAHSAE